MSAGKKILLGVFGVGALAGAYFVGTGALSTRESVGNVTAMGGNVYRKTAENSKTDFYMAQDGSLYYKNLGGPMVYDTVANAKLDIAKKELVRVLIERDDSKLAQLGEKYSRRIIDAALAQIASMKGLEKFRDDYAPTGLLDLKDLTLNDPTLQELAKVLQVVQNRADLVQQVRREKALNDATPSYVYNVGDIVYTKDGAMYKIYAVDNQSAPVRYAGYLNGRPGADRWLTFDELAGVSRNQLRETYGTNIDEVPADQREAYKQVFNARPENKQTAEQAEKAENERKRQEIYQKVPQPMKNAAKGIDETIRKILPPPKKP